MTHSHFVDYDEYNLSTAHLPLLPYCETMVTHGCTLSCYGCSNYSDYGMPDGNIRYEQIRPAFEKFFARVRCDCFGFIGGEPFLNKDFANWVHGFRRDYPYTMMMVSTNGQLFHDNLWFVDAMMEYGMFHLKFSDHLPEENYIQDAVDLIKSKFDFEPDGDGQWWCRDRAVALSVDPARDFVKTYRGEYSNMKPYDNDAVQAWEPCSQKTCPLLYKDQLFKCSSLALLEPVLRDHGHLNDPDWQPYLGTGLSLDCADQDLLAFVDNFNQPHPKYCRMCPSQQDDAWFVSHGRVKNKMIKIQPAVSHSEKAQVV